MGAIRIRHTDFEPAKVIEATFAIAEQIPAVLNEVEAFKARLLTGHERQALAIGAHAYRWEEPAKAPITPAQLLAPRRPADQGNDLWRTFNRVQEHLTKGGQPGRTADGKRTRVRGVEIHPVAQELKAWRLRNGLTQPQAAEVLRGLFFPTTFATVRHWEAGAAAPKEATAEVLSRLLKAHPTVSAPRHGPRGRKGKKA